MGGKILLPQSARPQPVRIELRPVPLLPPVGRIPYPIEVDAYFAWAPGKTYQLCLMRWPQEHREGRAKEERRKRDRKRRRRG